MIQTNLQHAARMNKILDFWFTVGWDRNSPRPNSVVPFWWGYKYVGDKCLSLTPEEQEGVDDELRKEFGEDVKNASEGKYDSWKMEFQGILALIILFDQIPRNIFRKKKEAYIYDEFSLPLIHSLIKENQHQKYQFFERVFLYLPLQHSENLEDQDLSLKMFTEMSAEYQNNEIMYRISKSFIGYAEEHREIVVKYGRYPHRNNVLGREFTDKEKEFMEKGGNKFGQ